jgi:hypothetical protein
MSKRKSKNNTKIRLKGRARRLAKAPNWVARHRGKPANMLKRYRNYFCIDWECAIAELQGFGVRFDELYLSRLRETIAAEFKNEKKQTPISQWEFDLYHGIEPTSDDTFAYIAGYTPGGVPFGTTWEEMEPLESGKKTDSEDAETDDYIPF